MVITEGKTTVGKQLASKAEEILQLVPYATKDALNDAADCLEEMRDSMDGAEYELLDTISGYFRFSALSK